jgi:hypothetical protein
MPRAYLAGLAFFCCALSIEAAEPSDFDFLVGTWDLAITSTLPGIPPSVRGRWSVASVGDGLVLADEYRAFDDKGATAYLGLTYRAFNPATREWDIRYLEPRSGKWYEAKGWPSEATVLVQQKGDAQSPDVLLRFQYYDIKAKQFLWRSERSDDGGKTWSPYGLKITATRAVKARAEKERR